MLWVKRSEEQVQRRMVEEKIICNKTLRIKCIWGGKMEQRKVGSWGNGLQQESNHFCELI